MNKVIGWIFGSFFRTLGRLFVYILLGFILFNLINLNDIKLPKFTDLFFISVYADSDTIKIYNTTLTSNNYVVVPSGSSRIINILGGNVYGPNGNGEFPPSYYIGTFCTDSSSIISWEGTSMSGTGGAGNTYQNTLSQINFFNTNYSCTFPNSSYTGGHIVYIYGTIDPIWNTSATSATLMGRISYNQPEQASWSLLSWSWSNEPIDIDYSNNTIISQNQDIINQNNTIINNQTNNTNSIINNQNANTQAQIDSQKVCKHSEIIISYDNRDNYSTIGYLNTSDGSINSTSGFRTSDYIEIKKDDVITITRNGLQGNGTGYCLYNSSKTLINCVSYGTSLSFDINVSQNGFIRFSGSTQADFRTIVTRFIGETCKNGNQAIGDSLNDMNSSKICLSTSTKSNKTIL